MMKNFLKTGVIIALFLGYGINANAQERIIIKSDVKETALMPDGIGITGGKVVYNPTNNFVKSKQRDNVIVSYDFEDGIPEDFELIDGNCGWAIGSGGLDDPNSGGTPFVPIPEHDGNYAYVNSQKCGGGMGDVWMILSPVDISDYTSVNLIYDQFNGIMGTLNVKISIDNKETWTDFPSEKVPSPYTSWITSTINLYELEDVDILYIAFHYNDGGIALSGWAVDNIIIEGEIGDDPGDDDFIAKYDFEEGMPEDFELINGTCGWAIGWGPNGSPNSGGSSYFPIPEHDGKYAFVNDDKCNGNMSNVWMILPPLDFSDVMAPLLTYDQYNSEFDILTVKVSNDNKQTWTDFPTERKIGGWFTSSISLKDFEGDESVHIAFHYNDQGEWGYGWAVDNIIITEPFEHDLAIIDIFPYCGIEGKSVFPKVVVKNVGARVEAGWMVVLSDNDGYSIAKFGPSIQVDETVTIIMEEWTPPSAGEVNFSSILVHMFDQNPENNTLNKTITITEDYSANAYVGKLSQRTYNEYNLVTGEQTPIGELTNNVFPRSEEFDGKFIYRLLQDKTICIVYPNGLTEPVGQLHGFSENDYGLSMTYDWNNDKWYIISYSAALYSFSMDNFEVTKISDSGLEDIIIAIDFAHNGFIYGPSFDGNLYKINPVTGEFTQVGPLGIELSFGQDVSFDYEQLRLYTFVCNNVAEPFPYGYYDISTGEFIKLFDFEDRVQRTPFVILNPPGTYYSLTFTVTDGTDPIEGATVTVATEILSFVIITDEDGEVVFNLPNGDYSYEITLFGFITKTGEFTIDNENITLDVVLTSKERFNITFLVSNINDVRLNANVSLNFEGNTLFEGTAINGRIVFNNVAEGDYTYNITYAGYNTISDEELEVNETKTVNVTMYENMGVPPACLEIEVDKANATLTWDNYKPLSFSYWNQNYSLNGVFHFEGEGYGVVFDLTNYPFAYITGLDFRTFNKQSGIYEYRIHIYDMDRKVLIHSTDVILTTGNDKWENVSFDNIEKYSDVNKVGVFLESLSDWGGDFRLPLLACDNVTPVNEHSYIIDLVTLNIFKPFEEWEYLMTLWVLTDTGEKTKVGNRVFQNYEVILNDISVGTATEKIYEFTELQNGTYIAGVRAVYETGTTETAFIEFEITDGVNIQNTTYLFSYYVNNRGLLTVDTDAAKISLEVWSMDGKLVKSSLTNSVVLPYKGVYVVKANIDGKNTNFKVVY